MSKFVQGQNDTPSSEFPKGIRVRPRTQSPTFLDCEMQRAKIAAAHPATRLRNQTDWNSARPPIRIPKTTLPRTIHPQRRPLNRAFVPGVFSFMVCPPPNDQAHRPPSTDL